MVPVDRPTVLVADDDQALRLTLQEILEGVGYTTLSAATGAEALQVVRRAQVHVGLLDVHMPVLSGFEVLRCLRRENRRLPVILMTSDPSREIYRQALDEGAVSLLLKPVDVALVRRAVAQVMERFT